MPAVPNATDVHRVIGVSLVKATIVAIAAVSSATWAVGGAALGRLVDDDRRRGVVGVVLALRSWLRSPCSGCDGAARRRRAGTDGTRSICYALARARPGGRIESVRAAVATRYGPPEVVRIRDVPEPVVGPRDLLVRVHVTTVTRTDCGIRGAKPFFIRGFTGLTRPKRAVIGGEFAGIVEGVGPDVTSFRTGERVFGFSEDLGAHAELLRIAEDGPVATIPEELSFEQAAPSTEASYYALTIVKAANVRSGQRVLVNGATGAIGSAAVQLLKERGASVTAVCDTPNVELVRGLGADRIIDRNVTDFTKDDQRYTAVVDAVGKSSFGRCRRLLEPGGQYLSSDLGPFWTTPLLALVTRYVGDKRARLPVGPDRDQAVIAYLRGLLESGAFRPVIDRRYPLEEIVEAYRYVETERKVGNVLIIV